MRDFPNSNGPKIQQIGFILEGGRENYGPEVRVSKNFNKGRKVKRGFSRDKSEIIIIVSLVRC